LGAIIIFAIVFWLFMIAWNMAFAFAIPLILDRNVGAIEAIKLSVSAVLGNLGGLIVLMLLGIVIALAGLLVLCFGLLVAFPVIWVANVVAYRMVFPRLNQTYHTPPPPPSAYQSTFGQGM
jgi:uncharacterized membrane protein